MFPERLLPAGNSAGVQGAPETRNDSPRVSSGAPCSRSQSRNSPVKTPRLLLRVARDGPAAAVVGRCWAASRAFSAGETVMEEQRPLVASVREAGTACANCLRVADDEAERVQLEVCSACRTAGYCSVECRLADAGLHSLECPLAQRTPGAPARTNGLPSFWLRHFGRRTLVCRLIDSAPRIDWNWTRKPGRCLPLWGGTAKWQRVNSTLSYARF